MNSFPIQILRTYAFDWYLPIQTPVVRGVFLCAVAGVKEHDAVSLRDGVVIREVSLECREDGLTRRGLVKECNNLRLWDV